VMVDSVSSNLAVEMMPVWAGNLQVTMEATVSPGFCVRGWVGVGKGTV
jgi:hypothetical protein